MVFLHLSPFRVKECSQAEIHDIDYFDLMKFLLIFIGFIQVTTLEDLKDKDVFEVLYPSLLSLIEVIPSLQD